MRIEDCAVHDGDVEHYAIVVMPLDADDRMADL